MCSLGCVDMDTEIQERGRDLLRGHKARRKQGHGNPGFLLRQLSEFPPARCIHTDWGARLEVEGAVADWRQPQAHLLPPGFSLNLGKDDNNLCLHFNPRLKRMGTSSTIVCNSKDGGAWGAEQRESAFPLPAWKCRAEVGWGLGAAGDQGTGWAGAELG